VKFFIFEKAKKNFGFLGAKFFSVDLPEAKR